MNRLSIPIGILVAIFVLLGIWYVAAHRPVPVTVVTQTATTTEPVVTQQQAVTQTPVNYPDEDTVASNIAGVWQSTDDQNYSIDVTSNGKWTDTYAGSDSTSAKETGTYELFTSEHPDKSFTGVLVSGVTYLKVSEGSTVTYYSVLENNGTNLQISYLDRGTTLSFVKTQ